MGLWELLDTLLGEASLNLFLGGNAEKADLGLLPGIHLFLGLDGALVVVIMMDDGIRGGVCIVSS